MRDNWINVEGKWLNLDAIRDIFVRYTPNGFYYISYSCNPYNRDINYDIIGPAFEDEEEAQEYLDKLLTGDSDE